MNVAHWARLYAISFAVAFVVIAGVQALKGHTARYALTQGLVWAALSATVFVLAAIRRWRKGQYCAVCADPPMPYRPGERKAD